MKALSIRQPWAWAILHAGKRIENREWKGCSYRGPILLHAAKGGTFVEWHLDFESLREKAKAAGVTLPGPVTLQMLKNQSGGIVGRARIDGVLTNESDFAAYAANVVDADKQRAWWMGGFALVLADVQPLPYVPWKGALGFFNVPDDYATRQEPTPTRLRLRF